MLTPEQANAIVDRAKAKGITNEEAAAELGIDLPGAMAKAATDDPWSKYVKADDRIPLQKVADHLMREDGIPEVAALKMAMQMDADAAKPLLDAEENRYDERATAAARAEWQNTAEGIATMGRIRQAHANALKTQAESMRPELEARGLPVDQMSDQEVVGWVEDMEEKRASVAEANSLDANLKRLAEDEAREGEGQ
jgi:hypothetical protein